MLQWNLENGKIKININNWKHPFEYFIIAFLFYAIKNRTFWNIFRSYVLYQNTDVCKSRRSRKMPQNEALVKDRLCYSQERPSKIWISPISLRPPPLPVVKQTTTRNISCASCSGDFSALVGLKIAVEIKYRGIPQSELLSTFGWFFQTLITFVNICLNLTQVWKIENV